MKVSKDKCISRGVDRTNPICYMKLHRKLGTKKKMMIARSKRSKTVNQVKSVENINKNPKFSSVCTMQKEVSLAHKLQDHARELQNPFKLKEDNPS